MKTISGTVIEILILKVTAADYRHHRPSPAVIANALTCTCIDNNDGHCIAIATHGGSISIAIDDADEPT